MDGGGVDGWVIDADVDGSGCRQGADDDVDEGSDDNDGTRLNGGSQPAGAGSDRSDGGGGSASLGIGSMRAAAAMIPVMVMVASGIGITIVMLMLLSSDTSDAPADDGTPRDPPGEVGERDVT